MNTAIAQHLNVVESVIVKVEEWANVLFVVAKGIGARFVSKKVAKKMEPTKIDKANYIASQYIANGYKAKVWPAGDKVRVYVGATGIYIEVTNGDPRLVGKNSHNEYNILRGLDLSSAATSAPPVIARRPLNLDYEMYHPNGMYYG